MYQTITLKTFAGRVFAHDLPLQNNQCIEGNQSTFSFVLYFTAVPIFASRARCIVKFNYNYYYTRVAALKPFVT